MPPHEFRSSADGSDDLARAGAPSRRQRMRARVGRGLAWPSVASEQQKGLVLFVVSLGALVVSLDQLVLNVALPTLARDLDASTSQLQWIVDSYMLVFAGLILVSGSLGDRFGRARIRSEERRVGKGWRRRGA